MCQIVDKLVQLIFVRILLDYFLPLLIRPSLMRYSSIGIVFYFPRRFLMKLQNNFYLFFFFFINRRAFYFKATVLSLSLSLSNNDHKLRKKCISIVVRIIILSTKFFADSFKKREQFSLQSLKHCVENLNIFLPN